MFLVALDDRFRGAGGAQPGLALLEGRDELLTI